MTDHCEPPDHLRGRNQLCWLGRNDERITVHWVPGWDGGWVSDCRTPREMGRAGWRYIAPVATPEDVADLRAERDAVVAKLTVEREYSNTLHARVETLEAALDRIANAKWGTATPAEHARAARKIASDAIVQAALGEKS